MFARVLRIQTAVDQLDAAFMLFEESVVPLAKNQPGFKGAQFLVDRKTGIGVLISLWETEEALLDSERSRFFQEQVAKFIGFFTAPPIRESYEVLMLDIS